MEFKITLDQTLKHTAVLSLKHYNRLKEFERTREHLRWAWAAREYKRIEQEFLELQSLELKLTKLLTHRYAEHRLWDNDD